MSATRFLLQAQGELATHGDEPLAVITVPAPVTDIDRMIRRGAFGDGANLLLWDAPALEADGRRWSFVGWGEAARVDACGEDRFDTLHRGASEIFTRVVERRHHELGVVPAPRLFGGIAFRPEGARPAPWAAFSDGSFAMPRWLYATNGERAFLRLAFAQGDGAARDEVDAVSARLAAPHGDERASRVDELRGAHVERTSPADWEAMVRDALARIRAHDLEKVVPMALCRVTAAADLDVAAALGEIRALYPECTRFAFARGEATFLGASPERLVVRRGASVEADALAGSRARDATSHAHALAALLASDKDRREHHVVVEAIRAALLPLSAAIDVPEAPVVRSLRNVHHLWTPITATLARPVHVLDLVRALHPTPAVCGTPRKAAIDWIAAHEPATRGWYAGAVGWCDGEGDGAFSVAIRSGVLARCEAWLYAGAGIVEGSDPAAEYAETRVKQSPMLAALGLLPFP